MAMAQFISTVEYGVSSHPCSVEVGNFSRLTKITGVHWGVKREAIIEGFQVNSIHRKLDPLIGELTRALR